MNLSKNLTLKEVIKSNTATRLGIDNTLTSEHLENLKVLAEELFQPLRDIIKYPIYISSGYRSKALNQAINGSENSSHCKGQAIDIDMDISGTDNVTNWDIFCTIKEELDFDTLIHEYGELGEPDWVHVSYVSDKLNRNRVLRAYKDKKENTKYELWKHLNRRPW